MLNKSFIFTLLVLSGCFLLFEFTHLDLVIQNLFYDPVLNEWAVDRSDSFLRLIFYDGIKILYALFVLLLLIVLVFFRNKPIVFKHKQGLLIVLLSAMLVPLTIGSLKAVTNVPCPKNIQLYGGDYPYVRVLAHYPEGFHQDNNIKCYPAGHASGGFALMSLFFLFSTRRSRNIALISAVMMGWSTGSYKMLIGDHFLSHTLVSMLLAWLIILLIASAVRFGTKRFPSINLNIKK